METPFTNHITKEEFQNVYEPAEDSFLLLDALEHDLPFILRIKPTICVEIGSGSGVIITALSKSLKNNAFCFAVDINRDACKVTNKTVNFNKTMVQTIQMDLTTAFRSKSIDVIIFNPPYVTTTDEEFQNSDDNQSTDRIIKSWAGGKDGRQIIDKLINQINEFLSRNGILYLLLSKENHPDDVVVKLRKLNFRSKLLMERQLRGEYLYVYRFGKN